MSQANIIPFIPQDYNGPNPISLDELDDYVFCKHNLLEYAQEVADYFWPSYDPEDGFKESVFPSQFCNRYRLNEIDTRREEKYLESEEVLQTLKAFEIDISKFWYLCLFIKDVIDGDTIDVLMLKKKPLEVLNEIKELLEGINFEERAEKKAELSIKLEGDTKIHTYSDTIVLLALKEAIRQYIPILAESNSLVFKGSFFNGRTTFPPIHRVYLFRKYLTPFLKNKKAKRGIAASKDKSLLISRMIYILGISDSRNFYEERFTEGNNRINYLKDYLKKYKPPRQRVRNRIYWF